MALIGFPAILLQPGGGDNSMRRPALFCAVAVLVLGYVYAYIRTSRMSDAGRRLKVERRLLIFTLAGGVVILGALVYIAVDR